MVGNVVAIQEPSDMGILFSLVIAAMWKTTWMERKSKRKVEKKTILTKSRTARTGNPPNDARNVNRKLLLLPAIQKVYKAMLLKTKGA